jgi:hypothetical protein
MAAHTVRPAIALTANGLVSVCQRAGRAHPDACAVDFYAALPPSGEPDILQAGRPFNVPVADGERRIRLAVIGLRKRRGKVQGF